MLLKHLKTSACNRILNIFILFLIFSFTNKDVPIFPDFVIPGRPLALLIAIVNLPSDGLWQRETRSSPSGGRSNSESLYEQRENTRHRLVLFFQVQRTCPWQSRCWLGHVREIAMLSLKRNRIDVAKTLGVAFFETGHGWVFQKFSILVKNILIDFHHITCYRG